MAITDTYKLNQPYMKLAADYVVSDVEAISLLPAYASFSTPLVTFLMTGAGTRVAWESTTLRGSINALLCAAERAYEVGNVEQFADWAVPHVDLPILRRWLDQLSGLI